MIGARYVTGFFSGPCLASTPTTRPFSMMALVTVVFSCMRAPACFAVFASISSKSMRGRTTP